jgi:hypothetical protein
VVGFLHHAGSIVIRPERHEPAPGTAWRLRHLAAWTMYDTNRLM